MNRLSALEALRGLLALWVLLGHTLGMAFTGAQLSGVHLGLLYQPNLGLWLFIILSGFVIFYLLDHGNLSYPVFVGRRFFRLAPLYVLVLTVSALMLPVQLDALYGLPWQNASILNKIATKQESLENLGTHYLVHLSLLQGVVPNTLLRFSDFTILGPAWSISLEWQFYLLAPLLFWLGATRRWGALGAVAAAFIVIKHFDYPAEGFIGNQFGYFLIGIISYYAFKFGRRLPPVPARAADLAAILASALAYFFLATPWHLMVWALVLSTITFQREGGAGVTTMIDKVLAWPVLQWLGQVSYSVYLWHMPVLYAVTATIERFVPNLSQLGYFCLALPGTVAVTLSLSAITYRYIEMPFIRYGKALGSRRTDTAATTIAGHS